MLQEVPLKNIKITDGFINFYMKLVSEKMLPYQWDALNDLVEDAEKSYSIENIKIAAGLKDGTFNGMIFQDSDIAKWIEAVAYCLQSGDASIWEERTDEIISLIAKAQQQDGYFNTYYQLVAPDKRFTNLYEAHELYCLGHFIEAAVAYYEATGKREMLDVFCRYADLVDSIFGNETGKIKGYPGHQEIELALAKLYETTGEERYLKLARYFLDERGASPHFFGQEWTAREGLSVWSRRNEPMPADFSYNQAHKPVREQTEAVGHAVRALYMYTAMADVGRLTNDNTLLAACRALFEDVCKQLYVTGAVGSTNHGEAFTFAYDLPNEVNYSETCASIALVFFMQAMLKAEPKGMYADVMERAFYNTVLASMSVDGQSYFYVNPMEVWPEASEKNPARKHVTARRQKWHKCACCPPNTARMLASAGKYMYLTQSETNTVFISLYAGSQFTANLKDGVVNLEVQTKYPISGDVKINISQDFDKPAAIALRIPGWSAGGAEIILNGDPISPDVKNGYAYITGCFGKKSSVKIRFTMKPQLIYANTRVRADAGKVCLQRGPVIYCLEQCDNGENLQALQIDKDAGINEMHDTIGGVPCIILETKGFREYDSDKNMYTNAPKTRKAQTLRFVPYHLWGNREGGEMTVWVRVNQN